MEEATARCTVNAPMGNERGNPATPAQEFSIADSNTRDGIGAERREGGCINVDVSILGKLAATP